MLLAPTLTVLNSGFRWTPARLPGLAGWFDASERSTVLTSIGPDTPANDGQPVRRWLSRHNPAVFWNQSVLAAQPTFTNAATGLTFNGSSHFMDGTGTMAGVFREKGYGYIFVVCQDTLPGAGTLTHYPVYFSNGTVTSQVRAGIVTRLTSSALFGVASRRLDADAFTSATFASNSNLNLLDAEFLWADNLMRLTRNGNTTASAAYPSGAGNTSNTASLLVELGNGATNIFPGNIREVVIVNEQLTNEQILATRRYLQGKWGTPALP